MSDAFTIRVDLASFFTGLDVADSHIKAAARPAAQAGAQVLVDEVRRNVATRVGRKTGNLAASIYQAYSKAASGEGHANYHVSWNPKKAPHGHLVEFGHIQRYEVSFDPKTKRFITHKDKPLAAPRQVAARPFVRPAVAAFERARDAMGQRYIAELQERGVLK